MVFIDLENTQDKVSRGFRKYVWMLKMYRNLGFYADSWRLKVYMNLGF